MKIGATISEPLRFYGERSLATRREAAAQQMSQVELSPTLLDRYPHELSGGQLQRVVIARALALNPSLLIADEPTASLDATVRSKIVDLLADLKARLSLTLIFISHDLATVAQIADEIAVMYLGKIVERGRADDIIANPKHPYTKALLNSVPEFGAARAHRLEAPTGEIPDAIHRPRGCHYWPRCPLATDICKQQYPPLEEKSGGRLVACHHVS